MTKKKNILGFIWLFLIALFFLVLSLNANATDYYFSNVSGSDSRTSAQAQSQSTPWRTLDKLSDYLAASGLPGDRFLLKRGETWSELLTISKSGSSSLPIIIGAYGTGNRPVITGVLTISFPNNIGGGIYESNAVPEMMNNRLTMVIYDGVEVGMGRFPNRIASSATSHLGGGFNTYESASTLADNTNGTRSITDNQLTTTPYNWTGAEVVIKTQKWLLGWWTITAHSGGTLSYIYNRKIASNKYGYGYFIQNDARTLDVEKEWYYNKATKKLRMHFGTGTPSTHVVEAAFLTNLLYSSGKNWVTIDNITFRGSNGHNISINGGTGVKITNCDILFGGVDNVAATGSPSGFVLDNCNVSDGNNNNVDVNGTNTVITNNIIRNSYMIPGLGGVGDGVGHSIQANGNSLVEYNHIKNAGYVGIYIGGNNSITRNNWVDSFCITKDDAGAIYTAHTSGYTAFSNKQVYNNILTNGIGNSDGTLSVVGSVHPIYFDDNENGIDAHHNFMADNGNYCMYLHNNNNQNIHHNTFYNGYLYGGVEIRDDDAHIATTGLIFNDNIFIGKQSNETGMTLTHGGTNPIGFGTFNNQIYARPVSTSNTVRTVKNYPDANKITNNYSLIGWQTLSGEDVGSVEAWTGLGNTGIIKFINPSKANQTFPFTGTYKEVDGTLHTSSVTITPYTGIVLIKTSGTAPVNNPPTVSITSPANGVNYTGPATIPLAAAAADNDGTISSVAFYQGTILLGSDNTSPYTYSWTSVPNGNYTVTAKATDDDGAVTTSTAITVNVTASANIPPTVSITSPANNATFTAPASITINATAADDGSVSSVAFYQGSTLLGTDNSSPFSYAWTSVAAGEYTLTAVATDNLGATTTSSAIVVEVTSVGNTLPTVSLTSPTGGATYTSPATITITANANDADGFISKVDFYNGTIFLQSVIALPYTWDWTGVTPGTYVITAKAYDDANAVTTSTSRTVTVNAAATPPAVTVTKPANNSNYIISASIPFEAIATSSNSTIQKVEFYHGGTTLFQTEFTAPYEFTRSGWTSGTYIVTAKVYDNAGGITTSSPITFVVSGGTNLLPTVSLTSPTEVFSYNNPATIMLSANAADADGSIANVKFYNGATLLHTEFTSPYLYTWSNVPIGVYTITARATDNSGAVSISGDIVVTVENALPIDSIISPVQGTFFYTPASIVIDAYATDSINGTVSKVDFYQGGTLLGTDLTAPYSYTWAGVTTGDYTLSIVATDNDGGTTQSGQVLITVGTQAPASLFISSNLLQTYDGTPKSITVVTYPPSLTGVSVTYDGSATAPTNTGIYPLVVTLTHANYIAESITDTLVIVKATPIVTWNTPSAITYLTALSGTQLNATASVAGTFTYLPASGTVLNAGIQTLSATFTPTDTNYNSVVANSVNLVVTKAIATITLSNLNQDYDGTPKPVTASISPVGIGTITTTYNGSTTPPTALGSYDVVSSLSNTNYEAIPVTGTLVISASAQAISISNINEIYNGTPRPVTITTAAEGYTVTYNGLGTVPTNAGSYLVIATITDLGGGADTATLIIAKANPVPSWPSPPSITYVTALGGSQLNASASVAGSFVYTPASGFIPNAGTQVLSAVFTPTDAANYNTISGITTTLVVNKAVTVLTFDNSTILQLWDGTAKSVTIISNPEVLSGLVVTYNGNANPPKAVGEYTVVVSLSNANYQAATIIGTFSIIPTGVPEETYNYLLLRRKVVNL